MNASIVCCYYNELDLIEKKFETFIFDLKKSNINLEIIIVDNNSNDGTKQKLKSFQKNRLFKSIKFIFNTKNLGKGGSIKKACRIAKGKYFCVFDVDEYSVGDLLKGIKLIEKKSFDLLVGSRIHQKNRYIYKTNYYGVRFLTSIINFFFKTNLTDAAGATKIFKKEKYRKINVKSSGFDFEFELICKFAKRKFIIDEFYNKYNPRTYEEGKKLVAWRDGLKILLTILKNIL